MAAVIDATAKGPAANCYTTLVKARAYYATQYYATAAILADDIALTQALLTATRLLDALVDWDGWVTTITQALLMPRVGLFGANGYYLDQDTIPARLEDATAEFARQLLAADRTADSDAETQGISKLTVGRIAIEFDHPTAKVIPDAVYYGVSLWGTLRSRTSVMTPLVRA
jgi:DnaT-like ssDNA binding protein